MTREKRVPDFFLAHIGLYFSKFGNSVTLALNPASALGNSCYQSAVTRGNSGNTHKSHWDPRLAVHLLRLGYAVLCPHLNSAFMSGAAPEFQFLEAGLEFPRRADLVVLVGGWDRSEGTIREIEEAQAHGIPIYVIPKTGRELTPLAAVEVCING